mgnify:CR=1 FL=1
MTMTDTQTMNPTAPGNRLVTVDDLRYELQRERAITDARFGQVDARFDRLEARFEARFDFLEQRLRFNKTLIVASLSAVASVASVVVSLLK